MKEIFSKELIDEIDSIILENRDLLSESNLKALEECRKRLTELENFKIKENYELRNQVIADAVSLLFRFFLSDL